MLTLYYWSVKRSGAGLRVYGFNKAAPGEATRQIKVTGVSTVMPMANGEIWAKNAKHECLAILSMEPA